MSEKNILNDEELEKVMGGYNFKFYDDEFDEKTKVSTLTAKYPWIVTLYPQLEQAAKYGITIKTACYMGNISYEQLQTMLTDFESKYDQNGNPKIQ